VIAQIDEQHAAVIADAMAPAGKTDLVARVGLAEFSAIMRTIAVHLPVSSSARRA
jgi:hypothetical protein